MIPEFKFDTPVHRIDKRKYLIIPRGKKIAFLEGLALC